MSDFPKYHPGDHCICGQLWEHHEVSGIAGVCHQFRIMAKGPWWTQSPYLPSIEIKEEGKK